MPMITDPMYVLPAAVEAAQRTASEIVAEAIRAAETAGYERGLREAAAKPAAPPDRLRALLTQAAEVLGEAEETVSGIDGYCDDLTVRTKRGSRRGSDSITVPDSDDSFDDVSQFLGDYGGRDLVDVDNVEIDADEVREASQETLAAMHKLSGLLSQLRGLLGVKIDADDEDADDDADGATADGATTEAG